MGIFLLCLSLLVGSRIVSSYDVLLTSSPDTVTHGDMITLICKVNSSLKLHSVTWSRNTTDIFSTSWKPLSIIHANYEQFKPIAGRFITTMHGSDEHHLILIASRYLDNGLSWRCGTSLHQSNVLVMTVVDPPSSTYCYESAGCMLGICTGVVFAVLLCGYLIALSRGQVTFVKLAAKSSDRKNIKDLEKMNSPYVNITEADTEAVPTTVVYKL